MCPLTLLSNGLHSHSRSDDEGEDVGLKYDKKISKRPYTDKLTTLNQLSLGEVSRVSRFARPLTTD